MLGRFSLLPLRSRLLNDRFNWNFIWISNKLLVSKALAAGVGYYHDCCLLKQCLQTRAYLQAWPLFWSQTQLWYWPLLSFVPSSLKWLQEKQTENQWYLWRYPYVITYGPYEIENMLSKSDICFTWGSIPANVATLIPRTSPAAPPTSAKNFSNP